ncbi:YkvA family protein [Paraclostridium bifermentans]|uniref:YkvA family protein n=1 Tax=Paraclostridium bifermentans TaxID=1490 RepID=UPI00359C6352
MIDIEILKKIANIFLDTLKKSLVRFKEAKFGLMFIINIFKLPDFYSERDVNIISKFKVTFAIFISIIYLILGIDFIPEIITGIFGFLDDIFVLFWSLGIINEEIEKYKKLKKEKYNPNIIEGVNFSIKDEE